MSARDLVRRLEDIDADMVGAVGGKGASLGELVRAGQHVPAGFVVTRAGFDVFLESADPAGRVRSEIADVEQGRLEVEAAEALVFEQLDGAAVPDSVERALLEAFDGLGVSFVSVRSSATCEDGAATAWAGQLETFLQVDRDHLVGRVRACWLSLFSAPALAYGAAHGYGPGDFGVAVVVQEMIESEVSGIGFSVHPVSQEPGVRLIEACFGLGEAIVGGHVVPDQYVVEAGASDVASATVGKQSRGLFLDRETGRPEWESLAAERGTARKLSDAQVLEYARLLDQIEAHYGHPVDTEWALRGGRFHLLQARPITTLAPEYREDVVSPSVSWAPMVRRPMPLVEASILAHWSDRQHSGRDLGFAVDEFLTIQGADGIANHFVSEDAFETGLAGLLRLRSEDRARLLDLFDRAHTVYDEGVELVERGGQPFRDLTEATEAFIRMGEFTTMLPAWMLIALDREGIDDPELREHSERLRARSLYPFLERSYVEPLVCEAAEKTGFSTPEQAPHVTTWTELRRGSLDRRTLEERWEEVQSGKRFVFQMLGAEESLRFVSETGYLLVRLRHERSTVASDDPNVLTGQAAWPGCVRGRARVVLSSTGEGVEMDDGDVLVSIQSSPALMPLLRRSGAIVTDDGGIACHAAILSRELQIPTVIGTERATATIRTGDLVEVDATAQTVRVLERAAEGN